MKKCTVEFLLIIFVILSVAHCQRWNNGKSGGMGKKVWRNGAYNSEESGGRPAPEANISGKNHSTRRGGVGAWGYVAIALFLILSGLGVYYTIIFYPIVCKKQRMYHVMGSTTV